MIVAIIVLIIVIAATGTHFDVNSIDRHWVGYPLPPCFIDRVKCYGHILGTDEIGRDVLARLLYGAIATLGIPLIAVAVEVILGAGIAISARGGGSILRFVLEQFVAALSCFPPWLFLLTMIMIGTPSGSPTLSIFVTAVIAGLVFSPRIVRVMRRAEESADRLPGLLNQAVYDFTRLILLLATIDFVGLGVQIPTASWGSMIRMFPEYISVAPWALSPAITLFGAVFLIESLRRLLLGGTRRASTRVEAALI